MLTKRQIEVLRFLREYYASYFYPPSVQEIADFMNVRCNTVQGHIEALERKNMVTKKPGKARSVVVTAAGRKQLEKIQ